MFSLLIFPILGLNALRVDAIDRSIRVTSRNPNFAPASASSDALSIRSP